jgi:hypothetical protein
LQHDFVKETIDCFGSCLDFRSWRHVELVILWSEAL